MFEDEVEAEYERTGGTVLVFGELGVWQRGTYSYISAGHNFRVHDARMNAGGQDPAPYAGKGGALPPFRSGAPAGYEFCAGCGSFTPCALVDRKVLGVPAGREWRCPPCMTPAQATGVDKLA